MSEERAGHGVAASEDGRGWFVRWRLPLLVAVVVVAIAATVTTVVIQHRGGGQTAAETATAPDDDPVTVTGQDAVAATACGNPAEVPRFTAPGASWVKGYDSLYALAGDSTNIVLASPTGGRHDEPLTQGVANPNVPGAAPNTYATLAVEGVLSGQDISVGQQIEVFVAGDDTNGCPMFSVPGQYLLFLAPYVLGESEHDPNAWDGQYIVISSYAGLYFHVPSSPEGIYARTFQDFEELPDEVDLDGLTLMAGWYDAAYLDHVAAGLDPVTLPPLKHPAGSVTSPMVGGPADPFTCNGAETTEAASPDEGGTLFGRAGTRFCVSIAGEDGPITRSELIVASTPLHATMRVGTGWESQLAGVVDGSITAVVAIRGADNALHPDDPLPDWEVALTPLGEMRAFLADDSTRAIVGYANGVEQFRWLAWPEFTDDISGGWGDGLQLYDERDDLTDLRPEALLAWAQTGPDTIRVFFTGGNSGCYGAVVTTDEDDTQVRVGVQTGWKPEVGACDDMAVGAAVDIRLATPLGDRSVAPLDLG